MEKSKMEKAGTERQKLFSGKAAVFCLAMCYCVLGGSAFPFIKIGYRLFQVQTGEPFSILLFAGVRFFAAGLVILAIGSAAEGRALFPAPGNGRRIAFLGLFRTTLFYSLFYFGLARTTGVESSILNGTNIMFSMLASCFLFRQERFTARKFFAGILCFGSILLMNLGGGEEWSVSLGSCFMVLSAVVFGVSDCMTRQVSQNEDSMTVSGWQFLIGGTVLAGIGFASGGALSPVSPSAYLVLFYLIIVSTITFSVWGILLKYNPVTRIVGYKAVEPICGTLLSMVILAEYEALGMRVALALALVCAGIYLLSGQRE